MTTFWRVSVFLGMDCVGFVIILNISKGKFDFIMNYSELYKKVVKLSLTEIRSPWSLL